MEKPSKFQHYELIRKQIEHEDGLVNQRFTWSLNSCGFLFVGYFSLLSNIDKFPGEKFLFFKLILWVICVIGFITCRTLEKGIEGARKSLEELKDFWYNTYPEELPRSKSKNKIYPNIMFQNSKVFEIKFLGIVIEAGARGVSRILVLSWIILAIFNYFLVQTS